MIYHKTSIFTNTSIEFELKKGSTRQHIPEKTCEKCNKDQGTYYIGTESTVNTLEFLPGVSADYKHWFHCDLCSHEWFDGEHY